MRHLYIITISLLFVSCSGELNGLWIESRELSLLKFDSDSVIYNSLTNSLFLDTLGFRRYRDSIKFTGLDWRFDGRTEDSFRYSLKNQRLLLWNKDGEKTIYLKSRADNFKDHFLNAGRLKLKLPKADNVKCDFPTDRRHLDIRMGFKDKKLTVFIGDEEINLQSLDSRIKTFLRETDDWEIFGIECRLFVDQDVKCGDTFFVVEQLLANEIRRIYFITDAEKYNPYSSDFFGILLPGTGAIEPLYKLDVDEENER